MAVGDESSFANATSTVMASSPPKLLTTKKVVEAGSGLSTCCDICPGVRTKAVSWLVGDRLGIGVGGYDGNGVGSGDGNGVRKGEIDG